MAQQLRAHQRTQVWFTVPNCLNSIFTAPNARSPSSGRRTPVVYTTLTQTLTQGKIKIKLKVRGSGVQL